MDSGVRYARIWEPPLYAKGYIISHSYLSTDSEPQSLLFKRLIILPSYSGFLSGSDSKESAYNAGNPGLSSGSGRSHGEGNGNPLQYSCLGNSMDRGTWWATVHGVTNSQTWQSD